jgi:hypothetical protein
MGIAGIAAGTAVTLYAMQLIDRRISSAMTLAEGTIEKLPQLIGSLPPALKEIVGERRPTEYAKNIEVKVRFAERDGSRGLVPAVTILNKGDEEVSFLVLRVVALDRNDTPVREWTEVVATPLGIDDDWRGPLNPDSPRHLVMSSWRGLDPGEAAEIHPAYEITEIWTRGAGEPDS